MNQASLMIGIIYSYLLNAPLRTISSEKKFNLSKLVSGLAICVLSCLSCGLYTIHIYKFYSHKNAINLQKELERAIDDGDCKRVEKLFQRYPILKIRGA